MSDYYGGEYLQDLAESRLLALGGETLRSVAHDIARAYVDRAYPDLPDDDEIRASAYIASLWQTAGSSPLAWCVTAAA